MENFLFHIGFLLFIDFLKKKHPTLEKELNEKNLLNLTFFGIQTDTLKTIFKNNKFKGTRIEYRFLRHLKNVLVRKPLLDNNLLIEFEEKQLDIKKNVNFDLIPKLQDISLKELEKWGAEFLSLLLKSDKKTVTFFGLSVSSPIIIQSFFKNEKIVINVVNQLGKKILAKHLAQQLTNQLNPNLVNNNYIYKDKIREKEEENRLSFVCSHFYFDLKKGDLLVLTKDFSEFALYRGMVGRVTKIVGYQKVELVFVITSKPSTNWSQKELEEKNCFFIKEKKTF